MAEVDRERLLAANGELRGLLDRLYEDVNAGEALTEGDLRSVSFRLSMARSGVGEASRSATLNRDLQHEIEEYVRNFRVLQSMLKKAQVLMLARRLEGAK